MSSTTPNANTTQTPLANPTIPPAPQQLSLFEQRIARILVHQTTVPLFRQRFQNSPRLTHTYERFLEADDALIELDTMSTILDTMAQTLEALEHPSSPILHNFIDTAITRRRDIRTRLLRSLINLGVPQAVPQLLSRGQDPITPIREANLCQNCGYVGHFPLQCPLYRCPLCSRSAPEHRFEDCPFRIVPTRSRPLQTGRRARPFIPTNGTPSLRRTSSSMLFPTSQ